MKAKLRIPTNDQYAFIEVDIEGEITDIAIAYHQLIAEFKEREGLPHLEWNRLLDKYVNTATMEQHEYDSCSQNQKLIIQELKKCFKRINKE